jgi:hypothetical protein
MNRYLKLVNFEFNRIAKVFWVLLAIVLVSQIAGVLRYTTSYIRMADREINEQMLSHTQFIQENGLMSFTYIMSSLWFFAPVALCIAAVAFYIFLIWYRDWFGKNTFIYRLLMLPTGRMNVFLAKLTAILLVTFGFVAFQLLILTLEMMLFRTMIPLEFRMDMNIMQLIRTVPELGILIPTDFMEFFLHYGAGVMAVSVLFTAILFERSFRLKGIAAGIGFGIAALLLFLSPVLVLDLLKIDYFYPMEVAWMEVGSGAVVCIISLLVSRFLIKRKVTV